MLPDFIVAFFAANQNLLWLVTVIADLSFTLLLYRLFGKMGLYSIIVLNIMLSNLQGPKLTVIFGLQTSLGLILYAGIYFATDLMSEKYGQREANRAVFIGFATSIIVVVMMSISLLFLPTDTGPKQEFAQNVHHALLLLFDYTPLFVFGSLFVYLISQSFDVWLFHYIKEKTHDKHLWLRNNGSTLTSQALDTVLYAGIVWLPLLSRTLPMNEAIALALELAMSKYIFKFFIALFDTPFIYWAREWDVDSKDWSDHQQVVHHTEPGEMKFIGWFVAGLGGLLYLGNVVMDIGNYTVTTFPGLGLLFILFGLLLVDRGRISAKRIQDAKNNQA